MAKDAYDIYGEWVVAKKKSTILPPSYGSFIDLWGTTLLPDSLASISNTEVQVTSTKKLLYKKVPSYHITELEFPAIESAWHQHPNGGGWVYEKAQVSDSAYVEDGSVVHGMAKVLDEARIEGSSKVKGTAVVSGKAKVIGNSSVHGNAVVKDNAVVCEGSQAYGNAVLQKDARVAGCVIKGTAIITGRVPDFETYAIGTFPEVPRRTQKARGVQALVLRRAEVPVASIFEADKITEEDKSLLIGKFIRPCPERPRHGFVDSRPINNHADLDKLLAETLAADPKAEIIAMPFIKANYSGVWTDGSLTIGPGNDGATAGRNSKTLPVQGVPHVSKSKSQDWSSLLVDAGITESPYMEILWSDQRGIMCGLVNSLQWKVSYVQLRNGPKLPQTVDYIPGKMEIKNVVLAEGDLLDWETRATRFPEGTVVYHPGGSLASHYAVHAFLNKIPVLVSREPKVGEVLEVNTVTPTPDINKLRAGFVYGCTAKVSYATAGQIMLAGCHSTAKWLGVYDELLGYAMGCAFRLLITASLGEARHNPRLYDRIGDILYTKVGKRQKPARSAVYSNVWDKILHKTTRTRYLRAVKVFGNKDIWSARASLGGEKWKILAEWAGKIYNALVDGDIKLSLSNLNGGVNAVHNGGWAFNKFLNLSVMDLAARNPVTAAIECAPELYQGLSIDINLATWFRSRKHMELEESDHEGANSEEAAEVKIGTESCGCCLPDCSYCKNLEGDCGCAKHGCTKCYPDGCGCLYTACHDCGEDDCKNCHADPEVYHAPVFGKKYCSSPDPDGFLVCTKPSYHLDEHGAIDIQPNVFWKNSDVPTVKTIASPSCYSNKLPGSTSPVESWVCTMPPEHLGPHEAWSGSGALCAYWPKEQAKPPKLTIPDKKICTEYLAHQGLYCTLDHSHTGKHEAWGGAAKPIAAWDTEYHKLSIICDETSEGWFCSLGENHLGQHQAWDGSKCCFVWPLFTETANNPANNPAKPPKTGYAIVADAVYDDIVSPSDIGETIHGTYKKVTEAHCRIWDHPSLLHIQYKVKGSGGYLSFNTKIPENLVGPVNEWFTKKELHASWGSSTKKYLAMEKVPDKKLKWIILGIPAFEVKIPANAVEESL